MDPRLEKKLFIVVCVLLAIFVGILTFYFMSNKEQENVDGHKSVKYNLHVYKNKEGLFCFDESKDCQDKVLAIEVNNADAKVLDVTDDGMYVLYNDSEMKLFDSSHDTEEDIALAEYDKYKIGYDVKLKKVVGIFYYGDEYVNEETGAKEYKTVGFYNISNEKKMYEGKYDSLEVVDTYLQGKKMTNEKGAETNVVTSLLDMNGENVLLNKAGICEEFQVIQDFVVQSSGCIGLLSSTIYGKDMKEIVRNVEGYKWSIDNHGNLYVIDDKVVNKYSSEGVVIGNSKSYVNILQVIKDYIVYVENGKLKITNEQDVEIVVCDWNLRNNYDGFTSGYRDSIEEEKEGIYLNYYVGDRVVSYYFDEENRNVTLVS